ncbi:MAG: oligosaccharide flippase family protein [Oscillospiraceae bacterium]|nr:oligosaccharide flippase family protein [Oscillospiraceae bacterium]
MKNLTEGNIYKNFLLFAIPMMLSSVFSQAYTTINTIIAGNYLGEAGLAAIGATASFITFISSLIWSFNMGVGIYIAKLFGAGEYERLKVAAYNAVFLLFVVCAIIGAIVIPFRYPIYSFLKVDPVVLKDADRYFVITILGKFFLLLNNFFVCVFSSMGSSSFPFAMSVISAFLNVGGNILSVTVFDLGVAGIALSSIASALVINTFNLIKFLSCEKALKVGKVKIKLNSEDIKEELRYAVPICTQQGVMSFASFMMSPIINGIGAAATASYVVVLKIHDLNFIMYQSSSKTLTNYSAQAVGAGKFDLIPKGVRAGLLQGLLFSLPVIVCCSVFAEPICTLFFADGYSGEAFNYAVLFVRFYLPFTLLNFPNNLLHSFFRGIAAMKPLVILTAVGAVSRVIASFICVKYFGMEGIYIGWVISWVCEMILSAFVYFRSYRNAELLKQHTMH